MSLLSNSSAPPTVGYQRCRRCNPHSLTYPTGHHCPDCDGTGWTNEASWASEPHHEIVPGLWQGGAWFVPETPYASHEVHHLSGNDPFTHVFDCWGRYGAAPHMRYRAINLIDGPLDKASAAKFVGESVGVSDAVSRGGTVLVRCQAGLNRSGLLAGLAMVRLGYPAETALSLIREKRSPWALCNSDFESFLLQFESK
jgi:hypothetical protein